MIVVSLLLIVVSGGLLAVGVSSGADGLVMTSIGLSLLAAGSLFVGIRQQRDALEQTVAGNRGGDVGVLLPPAVGAAGVARPVSAAEDEPTEPAGIRVGTADAEATEILAAAGARVPGVPEQTRRTGSKAAVATAEDTGAGDEDDPADEPAPEPVLASEVARLSQRDDEVVVVDGRPRYHLASCAHLAGREAQSLPVGEAIELGFTGCGGCSAATTLLGR